MELLLVSDIPVTTLKRQSLSFNPQSTGSNVINAERAWGGTVKQAKCVSWAAPAVFRGFPSSLPPHVLGSAGDTQDSGDTLRYGCAGLALAPGPHSAGAGGRLIRRKSHFRRSVSRGMSPSFTSESGIWRESLG